MDVSFLHTFEDKTHPPGTCFKRHTHKSWELVLITQGSMRVTTGKSESIGTVGSVYIRAPGVAHEEVCISGGFLRVRIAWWAASKHAKAPEIPSETFDASGRLEHALRWLGDLEEDKGEHRVLNNLMELALIECREPSRLKTPTWSSTITGYIQQHLAESVGVGQLARVAGMSEGHFSREFHLQTGFSPMAYVRKQRVEAASRLIAQSNTVFREVARQTGFRDEFEFSRVFRRVTGFSPAAFRQRRVGNER